MSKLSVLDLMKKNYNTNYEIKKLKELFFDVDMFQQIIGFSVTKTFTYAQIFDGLYLRDWPHRQTYASTKELLIQNDLDIDFSKKYTSEQLVNFIEVMTNILNYKPNFSFLKNKSIYLIEDRHKLMLEVLNGLIMNLGLDQKKNNEDWICLIPKNETLDSVLKDINLNLQWEIISYLKIKNNDLESKRKQLAYLATELYIEKDNKEKGYPPFDIIMNECTLILNNLHIRHNNKTGKWENEIAKNINPKEALEFCDILYNKMLQIILMRKDLTSTEKIENLSKSLKNNGNK